MATARAIMLPLTLLAAVVLVASHESKEPAPPATAKPGQEAVHVALEGVAEARRYVEGYTGVAWRDCAELYEDSEHRLQWLLTGVLGEHDVDDARTWLSAALTSHRTCIDGLREMNVPAPPLAGNVTRLLTDALAVYTLQGQAENALGYQYQQQQQQKQWNATVSGGGLLVSWDASTSKADMVVAKDGSAGAYKTIHEAVEALAKLKPGGRGRVVIHIKSGVYEENVEINRELKNVMLVGDGIGRTVVTGNRNVRDGYTTYQSATFGVSGDGFWARDMTFENTAGAEKHQAVALRVASDRSTFYRCSFNGYQDTLYVLSQRQFYRDCDIYGTMDFIFGNAAAVLQNCNIYVRRPMAHQANMITAQGRDSPGENTGISVHGSRVMPAQDFQAIKQSFRSYLGRPWKKYSRTVFMKTELDGLVDPRGWAQWEGSFALDTLFYGECMNYGKGAPTKGRVNWPGFHVLSAGDAAQFTVNGFIQGHSWIPETGVLFWPGL